MAQRLSTNISEQLPTVKSIIMNQIKLKSSTSEFVNQGFNEWTDNRPERLQKKSLQVPTESILVSISHQEVDLAEITDRIRTLDSLVPLPLISDIFVGRVKAYLTDSRKS